MKKIFTLFLLSTFFLGELDAQDVDRNQRIAEMKAKQAAYLSERVQMTPQEAEKFWPLYEEFRDKRMYLLRECRKERKAFGQLEVPVDKDYERIVDGELDVRTSEVELTKEYYSRFEKILSPKQLYNLMQAEESFARDFLKRGQGK